MLQRIDIGGDEFSFAQIANLRAVNFPRYPRCAERVARALVPARAQWEVRHATTVRTDIRLCKLGRAAMCSFAVTAAPMCTRARSSCMGLPMQLSAEHHPPYEHRRSGPCLVVVLVTASRAS